MDTLVAHPHHYSMAYPSSSRSSPHAVADFYPAQLDHHNHVLAQAFPHSGHSGHSGPSSLSISTSHSTPPHEPEEETAHPLRPAPHPPVPHHLIDVAQDHLNDAASIHSDSHSHPRPPSSAGSTSDSFADSFPGLSRPLTHQERELLAHLDRLKFFLATAPSRWSADGSGLASSDPSALPLGHPNSAHPALNRFLLPNSEYVSCVLWGGLYHITGTDIVRALVFRFEAFGRPVKNMKKFEEGVFSDLRNLKPGVDACLEEPKSPFLDLLFKYQCIRTQKKQKVFYWFSVPHDRLFLDALERDLKREKMGMEPTTVVVGEPAASFTYDPKRSLYDQFSKAQGGVEGEGELEAAVRRADEVMNDDDESKDKMMSSSSDKHTSDAEASSSEVEESTNEDGTTATKRTKKPSALNGPNSAFFSMFSLFEGSPTYKQRRKKIPKSRRSPSAVASSPDDFALGVGMGMYGAGPGAPMRMAEPQMDRYGRDTTRMSAAEMFLAQARGDFGPQSNPDLVATQKERQRRALQVSAQVHGGPGTAAPFAMQGGLSGPGRAGMQYPAAGPLHPATVMMPEGGMAMANGYPPHLAGRHPEQRHHTFPLMTYNQPQRSSTQPFDQQAAWHGETVKTKAFVCPLFSCGRMFSGMEYLKRHLGTHTLERPYQCNKCKRRFSRTDSLTQHLRTHNEDGSSEGEGVMGELEMGLEGEDDAFGALGPDMQMCEVEIQGQVHEVQGDEDGLVLPQGPVSHALAPPHPPTDEHDDVFFTETGDHTSPDVQWATLRAQPSPVFSTGSMPSPQPRITPSSSYSSSHSHLSDYIPTSSPSSANISVSAPSHKAAFDHASLYPPELGGGAGPIRRHRSATPSVGRYTDGITGRRPYTSTAASVGDRGYHPYAVAASAESSPMQYNVSLDYDPHHPHTQAHHPHHPHMAIRPGHHSRSSSTGQLQDQMQQMLHMESLDPSAAGFAATATSTAAETTTGLYHRADSPMQFNPTTYGVVEDPEIYAMGMTEAQVAYGAESAASAFYSTMHASGHPVSM